MLDFNTSEKLNLVFRWVHVFAAIMWVGSTYFFTWLDHRFHDGKGDGKVWMVHSGGFYVVDKRKQPDLAAGTLHWFKWEALITWISGISLLVVVYYLGGVMVDRDVANLSAAQAAGLGVSVLVGGWVLYDTAWRFVLEGKERVGAVVSYLVLVAVAFALTRVLSSRAAYIHVGAMMGTIMTANVWMRILPAQRRLVAAVKAGQEPDAALAARAKLRSKHNTFMAVPVTFVMIGNHFPVATYGSEHNWIVLSALILVGWVAAAVLRR